TVTVNAPLTANAGVDQVLCATNPQVPLAGAVTGGSGAWSGGAGTFSPNASALHAGYTPSAAAAAARPVTLTLPLPVPRGAWRPPAAAPSRSPARWRGAGPRRGAPR